MTLLEASMNIGAGVVYTAHPGKKEDGVITGVNDKWVFVRYGTHSVKATPPEALELLAPPA